MYGYGETDEQTGNGYQSYEYGDWYFDTRETWKREGDK